jgi:hypothetical protein
VEEEGRTVPGGWVYPDTLSISVCKSAIPFFFFSPFTTDGLKKIFFLSGKEK